MSALSCRTISRARSCLARARIESKGRTISTTSQTPQICPLTVHRKSRDSLELLDSQAARAISLAAVGLLTVAGSAQAGEAVPEGLTDLLNSWLDSLEALGPLGPAAFVFTIGICECIPFFPTQPLSICAGLLFGAGSGAALNLLGMSIASTLAFTLSRTVGRGLAEAVINAEVRGDEKHSDNKGSQNPVAEQIEKAQLAIENGGPLKQFTAILFLRLTPVVPFSASNYVLGLTPVAYGPFIGATVAGMSVWAVLLASLGGAGRGLVSSGENLTDAIAQVSSGAGEMTGWVVAIALALGLGALTMNAVAPSVLPDPEDLGKPEAEAEAKRQANLKATAQQQLMSFSEDSENERERDTVLATARSSRKRD